MFRITLTPPFCLYNKKSRLSFQTAGILCDCGSLEESELADDGKFLGFSVRRVVNADAEHNDAAEAEQASDNGEDPADEGNRAENTDNDTDNDLGNSKDESLVSVETCELGILGGKDWDQDEPGQVGENAHDLVLFDISGIELFGGVGGVHELVELFVEISHNDNPF